METRRRDDLSSCIRGFRHLKKILIRSTGVAPFQSPAFHQIFSCFVKNRVLNRLIFGQLFNTSLRSLESKLDSIHFYQQKLSDKKLIRGG